MNPDWKIKLNLPQELTTVGNVTCRYLDSEGIPTVRSVRTTP